MSTSLTRAEAHQLVDDCYLDGMLNDLAMFWQLVGYKNDGSSFSDDDLHEYVEDSCLSDATRANGPRDSDPSGLLYFEVQP